MRTVASRSETGDGAASGRMARWSSERRDALLTGGEWSACSSCPDRPADEPVEDRAAEDDARADRRLAKGQAEGEAEIAAWDLERRDPKARQKVRLHVRLHAGDDVAAERSVDAAGELALIEVRGAVEEHARRRQEAGHRKREAGDVET